MELDDLLEQEGLDGRDAEQTLQWARERAEQLVREMGEDPELGPLLSQAAAVSGDVGSVTPSVAQAPVEEAPAVEQAPVEEAPPPTAAELVESPVEPGATEAVPSDELDTTAPVVTGTDASIPVPRQVTDPPSFGLTAAQAELAAAEAELAAAQAQLAAVEAESTASDEVAAEAPAEQPELDPLAGIDFDSMPGEDEDEDEEQAAAGDDAPPVMQIPLGSLPLPQGDTLVPTERPDTTIPSMQAPLANDTTNAAMAAPDLEAADVTVRAANPLEGAEAPADEDEEEIEELEEFELLDDDMIELVEEEEEEPPADDGEVPEWQAAITSARLGGGQKADEDSGLLRPPTSPPPGAPESDDEDIDLGDL